MDLNNKISDNETFPSFLIANIDTFLNISSLDLQKNLKTSINILFQALDKYSINGISVSFNGGKDALVMLIIYLYTIHKYTAQKKKILKKIPAIYIKNSHSFLEIEQFIEQCSKDYVLDLVYKLPPMKTALKEYLEDHLEIKAILIGTRRCDPGCAMLNYFNPTDPEWPPCMRVHPIIDWRYSNIWERFLKGLNIKYCRLYDEGYTSIGSIKDTFRNPELMVDQYTFKPAYELLDENKERLSRRKTLENH